MNVNGKELAIEIDGPADAPVVLLVHGLGGTSNFYQPQTDALAERLRVIRVDSAGAGRSPVTDDISITGHAADLAAVLDALGVASASVVGHSAGTLVVRELAKRHPDKVSALVLLGAVREPAEAGGRPSATGPRCCARRAPAPSHQGWWPTRCPRPRGGTSPRWPRSCASS